MVEVFGDMDTQASSRPHGEYQSRSFDRAETFISCIVWPAEVGICGLLLYLLWIDPDRGPLGLAPVAASTVFLVLLIAAVACTIIVWLEFVASFKRKGPTARSRG